MTDFVCFIKKLVFTPAKAGPGKFLFLIDIFCLIFKNLNIIFMKFVKKNSKEFWNPKIFTFLYDTLLLKMYQKQQTFFYL